jgi:hypothetical protein
MNLKLNLDIKDFIKLDPGKYLTRKIFMLGKEEMLVFFLGSSINDVMVFEGGGQGFL